MSANDRRINQERLVVLVLGEFFEYSSPHTLSCPSRETRVDGLPLGVVLRQIAPWSAGPENPADRVDDLPVVDAWTAFASCLRGQNLANPLPLLRSQLMPSSHPRSSSPSGARWKSSRYSLRTRPSAPPSNWHQSYAVGGALDSVTLGLRPRPPLASQALVQRKTIDSISTALH